MSPQQIVEALQNFVLTNPACQTLASQLSPGTEIGVIVAERLFLTLSLAGGKVQVLERPAHNPPLILHAQPLAVEALIESRDKGWQQLSEIAAKQLLSGALRIERKAEWSELLQAGLTRAVNWTEQLKSRWR